MTMQLETDAMLADGFEPEELDNYVEFLDALRITGVTNMFGAGPYLVEEFGIGRGESRKVLGYWMKTFAYRHPEGR